MKVYHVMLEAKATVSQDSQTITVAMLAPTYADAWVDARTVARLGTTAVDAPRPRVFRHIEDDKEFAESELFHASAGVWTVRRIFVLGTRKTGKRRMKVLDANEFAGLLESRGIKTSAKLAAMLAEVLTESGGVKITVATARRLGIVLEQDEAEEARQAIEEKKAKSG